MSSHKSDKLQQNTTKPNTHIKTEEKLRSKWAPLCYLLFLPNALPLVPLFLQFDLFMQLQ